MRFGVMIEKTGPSSAYQYNSLTQRLADWDTGIGGENDGKVKIA
jgi:hypothetical protein